MRGGEYSIDLGGGEEGGNGQKKQFKTKIYLYLPCNFKFVPLSWNQFSDDVYVYKNWSKLKFYCRLGEGGSGRLQGVFG